MFGICLSYCHTDLYVILCKTDCFSHFFVVLQLVGRGSYFESGWLQKLVKCRCLLNDYFLQVFLSNLWDTFLTDKCAQTHANVSLLFAFAMQHAIMTQFRCDSLNKIWLKAEFVQQFIHLQQKKRFCLLVFVVESSCSVTGEFMTFLLWDKVTSTQYNLYPVIADKIVDEWAKKQNVINLSPSIQG